MTGQKLLNKIRERRKKRIRAKIRGAAGKPRLSIFKSNRYLYAQLINDENGRTLASASGKKADEVGKAIAKEASEAGITDAIFDKGRYKYHGQIKTICETARANGLKI